MWLDVSVQGNIAASKNLLKLAFWLTLVLTWVGFAAQIHLVFDLASHFRVQYLIIQLLGLIWVCRAFQGMKRIAFTAVTLAALTLNASLIWAYASPAHFAPTDPKQAQLKLLQMNVLVFNKKYEKIEDIIRQSQADIVSLQEIDTQWFGRLKQMPIYRRYPYRVEHLKAGNILLSKLPIQHAKIVHFPEGRLGKAIYRDEGGYIVAELNLKGQNISLINLHPPVPISTKYIQSYQRYLSLLAAEKPNLSPTVILLGDLNTTPWSWFYGQYLKKLDLKDAKAHHYLPTWPTIMPWFFLPIDHVFVSNNVQTISQRLGPFSGSDHFPVEVVLQVP